MGMRISEYSEEDKRKILMAIAESEETIAKSCEKLKISIGTYYQWKRQVVTDVQNHIESSNINTSIHQENLKTQNLTLRNLYINLSQHNYELAKFLNNQL
jgi:transposase-like protein